MGGVRKTENNQANNQQVISIAIALTSGLGQGGNNVAQAYAGPNGAAAFAGNQLGGPGGLGSMCGCGANHNPAAMANNFGGPQQGFGPQGPQTPFQQGFQQGMQAARRNKLMRKLRKLLTMLGANGPGGMGGPQFGGPQFGGPGFGGAQFGNGAVAYAGAGNNFGRLI
jgi:hypothetical protein